MTGALLPCHELAPEPRYFSVGSPVSPCPRTVDFHWCLLPVDRQLFGKWNIISLSVPPTSLFILYIKLQSTDGGNVQYVHGISSIPPCEYWAEQEIGTSAATSIDKSYKLSDPCSNRQLFRYSRRVVVDICPSTDKEENATTQPFAPILRTSLTKCDPP